MILKRFGIALGLWASLLFAPPAFATVSTLSRTVTYSPSSDTTVFTVTYPFLRGADLVVTKVTEATDAEQILTLGTDYTVRLPVGSAQGSVTTTVAVTSDYTLRIERCTPWSQPTSFRTQGTFRPSAHEDAVDRLTMELIDAGACFGLGDDLGEDVATAIADHEADSDPHSVYWKLAGRSGGQIGYGGTAAGENAQIVSTTNGTKGSVILGSDGTEFVVDDVNNRVGIGTATPSKPLEVVGTSTLGGDAAVTGTLTASNDVRATDDLISDDDLSVGDDATILGGQLTVQGTGSAIITISDGTVSGQGVLNGSINSGGSLALRSTTHATKGKVKIGSSGTELVVDDVNDRVGIGTASPADTFEVHGTAVARRAYTVVSVSPQTVPADGTACNRVYFAQDTITEFDLPALSDADSDGCMITFVNVSDSTAKYALYLDPNGTDKMYGSCGTDAATFASSAAAGKGVRITAGNSIGGETITIVGINTGATYPGWYITACPGGTWTQEP